LFPSSTECLLRRTIQRASIKYRVSPFRKTPVSAKRNKSVRRRPAQPIVKKRSHLCDSNRCRCSLIDRGPEELAPGSEYKANTIEIRKHTMIIVSPSSFLLYGKLTVDFSRRLELRFDTFFDWSINKIFFFWLINQMIRSVYKPQFWSANQGRWMQRSSLTAESELSIILRGSRDTHKNNFSRFLCEKRHASLGARTIFTRLQHRRLELHQNYSDFNSVVRFTTLFSLSLKSPLLLLYFFVYESILFLFIFCQLKITVWKIIFRLSF